MEWLQARVSESPSPLRERLQEVVAGIDTAADLSEALFDAARARLDDARGGVEHREAALDLLVADGLLTLACEAAAYSDPEAVAQRCRAMGPSGAMGRVAERWAGRS
ncbi:MAG: hypothetical protein JSV86_00130 [Gemmatimonadota bacterium]|nr:MAG: hypothetical protein JSV86_00130 [Gemmatimonadota bacterium]